MTAALFALTLIWGETYLEQNHGQFYHDTEETINEYHIDDLATVGKAIREKHITFKWEF